MADLQRPSLVERDIDQAITALKKGAHLLKYGRRGKPKFCPFRLSTDETTLIWYYGKDEKRLELRHVSRIIPGQRTSIFQRYPRPEKEYQSFSLIYNDRSLDLICKDKDEAEVWFAGLKALIGRGNYRRQKNESRCENALPESPRGRRITPSNPPDQGASQARPENAPQGRLGKAFADVLSYTAATWTPQLPDPTKPYPPSLMLNGPAEAQSVRTSERTSGADTIRVSLSSAMSSSSQGSCVDDFDNLGDVFMWGEGVTDGVLGGSLMRHKRLCNPKGDALLPKALESTVVLDVQRVACGRRHAVLVTRQGDVFSWGEEDGGRLGHGVESDIPHPRLVHALSGKPVDAVACGDHHTCAVTLSGDLYMWGVGGSPDGSGHWLPKRIPGPIEGLHVSSVACGPWHTAVVTSAGRLFTFGDGTFGALGHGDQCGASAPREVEGLKGLRTKRVACGVWHTAAVVELPPESGQLPRLDQVPSASGKLFTWGDGDRGQLGHGDCEPRLVPEMVSSLANVDFCRVACGNSFTVALTTSGWVYAMGSKDGGQRGKLPICVRDSISEFFIEEIACGSHHVAVLTSKSEVYTWGKGSNGQLGHGDVEDRNIPTLVESLKDKQVRSIACGSNFTAVICLHKWISTADNSVCSGCQSPFNFIRKRHNCYNCGLVFCKGCSTRKSLRASLAPNTSKPYRVCDDCFSKLQKVVDPAPTSRVSSVRTGEKDVKGSIPRLSSAESFKSDRNLGLSVKLEAGDNRIFQLSMQRPSTSSKSPTSPFGSSQNFLSFFMPDPKMISRSPSPIPGKTPWRSSTPSPPMSLTLRTSEANGEEGKGGGEGLSFEVRSLRAQVESLTSKSQLLETELERKSKQLKEMTARAADEAEKSKAAKEVIKSLTAQLKEMSEKVADDQFACSSHLESNEQTLNDPNRPSNWNSVTSVTSPKSESSDNANAQPIQNRAKAQAQKSKRIVQDEAGVYITLVTLPNGANELKRVRFSRKRFTEEEAEKWWAENGTRVCEQHNIMTVQ